MALMVKSHHQMLASSSTSSSSPSQQRKPPPPPPPPSSSSAAADQPSPAKRKRRPPGTPDPDDAEVVALSPRTLLESDRGGRRRWQHWRVEEAARPRKRVFVCPELSCLHHDPAHALGDLVGIKKHFRRKHGGGRRQWVCARCAKGYAVQSDYKAHLKTCAARARPLLRLRTRIFTA
ncbi:hypothetical protein PR202_ga26457 [Eleusine coracana subsp. coracana]|uniref:Uncharacterized protein n=1 Tax=Eleusine coracana subsp. coracana TaxID=191504 RepID=A0AAV5DDX1_ELECO|nr:hypothetical protein PR202_ga26457 [Eleusine coracana subsp. coracana]